MKLKHIFCLGLAALFFSSALQASVHIKMEPTAAPAEPNAINLGTSTLKNRPVESWFSDRGQRVARNISTATITPYIPKGAKGQKFPVIIILPGGAFSQLSLDNEGWPVGQYFADRGIAAFVLKYRLNESPEDLQEYNKIVVNIVQAMINGEPREDIPTPRFSVEDTKAAFALIRKNTQQWPVNTDKIGLIGFSAGAMVSLNAVMELEQKDMPAFLALIYGPMVAVDVPAGAPPLFAALAIDDPIFGGDGFGLIESWRSNRIPTELHFFQNGGHGFGMGLKGTATENWLEQFMRWLKINKFTE
ncbi:alpha/beta hydrolase [Aliiglaciecola sp. NS0011-25]|uniref:alpha/beta hydrolase n=1 Tax=Aliiglaciecola sp. NS0011-25 TaxID=3127654 RepID=UPI00310488D8